MLGHFDGVPEPYRSQLERELRAILRNDPEAREAFARLDKLAADANRRFANANAEGRAVRRRRKPETADD